MARLNFLPKTGKKPAFGGNLSVRVSRGRLVTQKWPKKRGKPKSQITRDQNEWFRQANLLAKYAPSDDQWMAIEVAKGSPWYPRDLLMSAMKGRLFEVLIIDGQEWRSVATRDDVSSDLDFLAGTVEGTIIVRGPDFWQALIPAEAGKVLTSQGLEALPAWGAGGAGGGPSLIYNRPASSFSGSAFAFKGYDFSALSDFEVTHLGGMANVTVDHVYRGYVLKYDNTGLVTEVVATTDTVVAPGTGRFFFWAEVTTTAAIVKGEWYIIGWAREDGADTFAMPCSNAINPNIMNSLPEQFFAIHVSLEHYARIAKAVPGVGDAVDTGINASFYAQAGIVM